jgi:alpha-glucosidase (family GH31 glycosyl hydrolase)
MDNLNFTHERYSFTLVDEDENVIMSSKETYFRYMQQYVSFEVIVPSLRFYGLGERVGSMGLKEGTYVLFNKYGDTTPGNKTNPGQNLSGMHPFLLFQLSDHTFAAIFLRTSLALEVKLLFGKQDSKVRFTTIGGIIDFYCFYKGRAELIVKEYHQVIGRPDLPPLWAFGYHHGKSDYKGISELGSMIELFIVNNFPLDAIWIDTDLLDKGKNFIVDEERYASLKGLVYFLHQLQIHVIVPVKEGIAIDEQYEFYKEADRAKCLVRDSKNVRNLIGSDRYGNITYPNFFNPNMCPLWEKGLAQFYESTSFDGLYLTMNEPYNDCNGDCLNEVSDSVLDDLPFTPGNITLNTTTLSMSATYPINQTTQFKELYVHSLSNLVMTNCTYNSLKKIKPGVRTLLMSAATSPGTQKFTSGYFFMRTASNWNSYRHTSSISLNSALFGHPFTGSSICGYYNNSCTKLCLGWIRIGMFNPLSVNFNAKNTITQDPYEFFDNEITMYKQSILFKYSLVRYIYTKVFLVSLNGGLSIQPLFFIFPGDDFVSRNIDRGFIYGEELLISTSLDEEKQYSMYLPNANWFKFPSGDIVWKYKCNRKEGITIQLSTTTSIPHLFLKGGSIIPYQDTMTQKLKNITELANIPLTLIVALDEKGRAKGEMVVDDGITDGTIINKTYRHYKFTLEDKLLKVSMINGYLKLKSYTFEYLSRIEIWGAKFKAKSACILACELLRYEVTITHNEELEMLIIEDPLMKLLLKDIEAIILHEEGDYNYCNTQHKAMNLKVNKELNKVKGELVTLPYLYHYTIHGSILSKQMLNLKIRPVNWTAWELPHITQRQRDEMVFGDYRFGISREPFYFLVTYPDYDQVIVSNKDQPLIITQNFTMLSLWINSTSAYGVGERQIGRAHV